jgi:AcrR family transcriptional regulator
VLFFSASGGIVNTQRRKDAELTVAVPEQRTERRILDAATALFYERGYHATTMREVASAVGIKAGSLYNHVPGKQELLFRIARGTMDELLEGGRAAVASHDAPREQLRALVAFHVVYHAERRHQARVADEQLDALEPALRTVVVEARDAYAGLFKAVLDEGRLAHGWRVPSTSVITFAIGGMCTHVDAWYREEGPLSAQEIASMYADFVLAALEAQPSSRSLAGS